MDKKELEFQKRIQATFRIEAKEHIQTFSANLIDLEKTTSKKKIAEIIEVMFREVHSLKGAARSVDQKDIESICLPLESIFSALKRQEIDLSPIGFDLFYKTMDFLSKLVDSLGAELTGDFRQIQLELIRQLKEMPSEKAVTGQLQQPPAPEVSLPLPALHETIPETAPGIMPSENAVTGQMQQPEETETKQPQAFQPGAIPEPEPETKALPDILPTHIGMIRIPISKIDPLLLQAEEMIQSKISVDQRTEELLDLCAALNEWKAEALKWRNRKTSASLPLWNEWCDASEIRLHNVEAQLTEITRAMEHEQHNLDRIVNNHLEAIKQVLMLPVGSLVETFPGMVREISRNHKKEINFVITGTELEIDKRILEELKDPLIHLIRNSIDHGIGKPEERLLQNKPVRGNITLAFAAKESGQVEIMLSDDGNGIDMQQVIKAAIKSGTHSKETAENLEPKEAMNLIYQLGISTSAIITDISGHGLGLSIVNEKVGKLNGKITVESETNMGTTFRILVPMALAAFRGILVIVKESMFILPTVNVERVMRVEQEKIKTIEKHETLRIDDQVISVADLGEVLGLPEHKHSGTGKKELWSEDSNQIRLVVLVSGDYRIAFKVDYVDEEQQVLVKGLGKLLNRVRNISGATILGSGKVVPVLNVADLMKSALNIKSGKSEAIPGEKFIPKSGKILVAEDSITSRTLLKNILQTSGYKVTTAVDGADAFTKARTGDFDIIISDVDMPKMNGFELTAKIRGDKKLGEIPVVLVTALESRDDREHGI